jgi:hypothetical protein
MEFFMSSTISDLLKINPNVSNQALPGVIRANHPELNERYIHVEDARLGDKPCKAVYISPASCFLSDLFQRIVRFFIGSAFPSSTYDNPLNSLQEERRVTIFCAVDTPEHFSHEQAQAPLWTRIREAVCCAGVQA